MTKQADANYCHDVILPILMDEFIGEPDDGFGPDDERYSPDLIVHNYDRVDELIRLSQERGAHDPKLLRYLLDNPTHSAVTIGTL